MDTADAPLKMLVIDDFVTMTRVMKTLAHRIGFEHVDVCHDGLSALDLLRSGQYGFVLCDLEMQPISGTEFARRARAELCGRPCVILLTSASRESAAKAVREGMHAFVDGFILKPFNSNDLKAKLMEIAARGLARKTSVG
jgi:two-component system chemotaxis response regulator CheY